MSYYQPNTENQLETNIFRTKIPGLYYIAIAEYLDDRGAFSPIAEIPSIEQVIGQKFVVKQVNHARSKANVIRGFHCEDWNKLIFLAHGTAHCVIADVNPQSQTFLEKETFLLGDEDQALKGGLFISRGLANSVCVVNAPVEYIYCVDQLYSERDPANDQAISLFDSDIKAEWPISKDEMIISDRDRNSVSLRQRYPKAFE